jgi:hypothetical protein
MGTTTHLLRILGMHSSIDEMSITWYVACFATFVIYKTSSSPLSFSCIQSSRRGVNTNSSSPNSAPPMRGNNRAATNVNADVTNNDPDDDGAANEGEADEDVVDDDIADDNLVNVDDGGVVKKNKKTKEDKGSCDSSETMISKEEVPQTIVSCETVHKENAC